MATSKKGSFSTAVDIAEMKETFRPRRDLKYLNATMSISSAGGGAAGFGREAPESEGTRLGAPKNGDTEVGAGCADLTVVSNAKEEGANTAGGWAVKENGLDADVPAPNPTNPPNFC